MSKIIDILKDVLECEVNKSTNTENCDEWDSMNHVNVILELQEEYNIKIPYEDIDKLKSVKDIEEYFKIKNKK